MSTGLVSTVGEIAASTAVDAAWAQWSAVTVAAAPVGERRAWSVVDPEALILVSILFGDQERRLVDLVAAWARDASFLVSVQRMQTLRSFYPADAPDLVGEFAWYAAEAGDRRWRKLVPRSLPTYAARAKRLGPLQLLDGPALTLRLRAGFGVNAKAEVLSILLGLEGTAADLKLLAAATGYTERAIRDATREMTLAGFIQEIGGRPASFYVVVDPWLQLLQTYRVDDGERRARLPPWRFWSAVFSFLASIWEWSKQAHLQEWSGYVASSRARDLFEQHEPRLRQAQFDFGVQTRVRGTDFLDAIQEVVTRLRDWVGENL